MTDEVLMTLDVPVRLTKAVEKVLSGVDRVWGAVCLQLGEVHH
jgi:hypothetical protein